MSLLLRSLGCFLISVKDGPQLVAAASSDLSLYFGLRVIFFYLLLVLFLVSVLQISLELREVGSRRILRPGFERGFE